MAKRKLVSIAGCLIGALGLLVLMGCLYLLWTRGVRVGIRNDSGARVEQVEIASAGGTIRVGRLEPGQS